MRAPPPVSLVARPGDGWRVLQSLLHAAAALAFTAWVAAWLEAGPWGWLGAAGAALAAAGLGWRLSAAASTRLAWSGSAWTVEPEVGTPVAIAPPRVMLDLDRWVLLRWRPEGGGRGGWLAVSAADAGSVWHLFRAAVYSFDPLVLPRSPAERPPT